MLQRTEEVPYLTPDQIAEFSERGRSRAAVAILLNPDARTRVEEKYGIEFCKKRWPEAYTPTFGL
jgi:hypothetical protein